MRTALVLSGGGMFGAWQAGAWSALAGRFTPDLVVGASVGSLNGYLIASRVPPEELRERWLDPRFSRLRDLEANVRFMTERHQPSIPFALTITDLLRLKPKVVSGLAVTGRHLLASCAIPIVFPQVKIEGRWYTDGGLLNPLPVWAAVELGATRIVGLNSLPEIPSSVLKPFIKSFRWMAGHDPPVPPRVKLDVLVPSQRLGTVRDAIGWRRENIERWYALGAADATRFLDAR